MKVLIIDDEADTRSTLKLLLKMEGIYSSVAGTVAEAKRLLGCDDAGPFDIVVLDLMMPDENGHEFLAWKRESQFREIPVIVCSGFADAVPPDAPCVKMVLTKPADVIKAIKTVISHQTAKPA